MQQRDRESKWWQDCKREQKEETRRGHWNNNFDSQDDKKKQNPKLAMWMILTRRRDQSIGRIGLTSHCEWFSQEGGTKVMAELIKQRQTTWKSANHLERKADLELNQKAVACVRENGVQCMYPLSNKEKRERKKEWASSSTQSTNTAAKPEFLGIFVKGTVKFISFTAHMIQYVGRLQCGTYLFNEANMWQSICTMVGKISFVCSHVKKLRIAWSEKLAVIAEEWP